MNGNDLKRKKRQRNIVIGTITYLLIGTATLGVFTGCSNDIETKEDDSNYVEGSSSGVESDKYFDCIEIDTDSFCGAVFNMSFSDVKKLVGRKLSIGDLNSSSGGWNQISSTSTYTEYSITSSAGMWAVNIGVDSKGKVFMVVCSTVGLDNGNPSDTENESFCSVFAEIMGMTPDSVASVFKELYVSGDKVRSYAGGIQCAYEKTSGGVCRFGITAMSEEHWNNMQ
ncbi:MAG: hypothetical protein E7266_01630 [Lachnospiraceae bacterium]|nr:hypothetical protein [Lachnospiraceae bacterium]